MRRTQHGQSCIRLVLAATVFVYAFQGMGSSVSAGPAIGSAGALARLAQEHLGMVVYASPGVLSGRVLYPDGKSPARGSVVRVWNKAQARFALVTRTDAGGTYSAELSEGKHLIIYGDRVFVPVDVVREGRLRNLDVIIPRGKVRLTERQIVVAAAQAAGPPSPVPALPAAASETAAGQALAAGATGLPVPILFPAALILGGTSAVAVGILTLTGTIGGGDNDHRSFPDPTPTSPASP